MTARGRRGREWVAGLVASLLGVAGWAGEPVTIRVVAANLTSDDRQTWSPDNGNHSNPEGAGARILKALRPDVVLMQEFNTSVPVRQFVNATLGKDYSFMREEGEGIPNGVISRFPILEAGEWDDPLLDNRDFAWARLDVPGGRDLWAVSLHWHSKKSGHRVQQAKLLLENLRRRVPERDLLVVGGDLNTRGTDEACLAVMAAILRVGAPWPADAAGDSDTNAPRNRPYDWVLADRDLDALAVPVRFAGSIYQNGLVFDSRAFAHPPEPVRAGDSGLPQMQHMAVVRDFRIP